MLWAIVLWVALSCLASPLIGATLAKRLRAYSSPTQRQTLAARRLQALSQSLFRANRMLKARTLVVDNGNRHVSGRLPAHAARQGTCREIRIVNACTRTTRRHHRTVDKWISSQHRSPGFPIRPQRSAAVTEAPGCQECLRFRGILLHTDDSAQIYSSFVGSQKEWAPDSIRRPSRQPGNTEAALTAPNANLCEFCAGVH